MSRIYLVKAVGDITQKGKFKEFSNKDVDIGDSAKTKAFDYAKQLLSDDNDVFQVNIIAQDV